MFNHESPLRGENFVTRKVTRAVARIKLGLQHDLHLGDLSVVRDWGFAGDYVEAMWRMLQQDEPRDYVVATGQAQALSDFVSHAFASVGLDWQDYVRVDQSLLRRAETAAVVGDASLASTRLGWKPRLSLGELLHLMVQADMRREQGRADEIDYFGEKETP